MASDVQVLVDGQPHDQGLDGRLLGANEKNFKPVTIGEDCWIGASVIAMANVGPRTTVDAGAIMINPLHAGVAALGSPAHIVECATEKPALEATAARN